MVQEPTGWNSAGYQTNIFFPALGGPLLHYIVVSIQPAYRLRKKECKRQKSAAQSFGQRAAIIGKNT